MSLSGRFTSRMRVAQRSLRSRPTTLRLCVNQTRSLLTVQSPLNSPLLGGSSNSAPSINMLNSSISIRTFGGKAAQATEGDEATEAGDEETTEPNKKEEAESGAAEKEKMSEEIAELQAKIKELEKQSNEFKNAALEYKAEVFNVRKRGLREVENAQKYAVEKFAKEMLTIADNIDLALKNVEKPGTDETNQNFVLIYEGMEMNQKTIATVFKKFNLVKAESMGLKFDINIHEVLFQMPGEEGDEPGKIKNVVRDGYWLKDRALRSAQVGVVQV